MSQLNFVLILKTYLNNFAYPKFKKKSVVKELKLKLICERLTGQRYIILKINYC